MLKGVKDSSAWGVEVSLNTMLWDLTWAYVSISMVLIIINIQNEGGNNKIMQVDGIPKLQPLHSRHLWMPSSVPE
jgi:hypothetical protein